MERNKNFLSCPVDSASDCWKLYTLEMVNAITNIAEPSFTKEYGNLVLENKDLKKQYKMAIAALDSILSLKDIDKLRVPEHWINKERSLFDEDKYQNNFAKLKEIASWNVNQNGDYKKETTEIIKKADSNCVKFSKVPAKLHIEVSKGSDEDGVFEKEKQHPKANKIQIKSQVATPRDVDEHTEIATKMSNFNCARSPKIVKIQAKLQDIASRDVCEDTAFEKGNTQIIIKTPDSKCVMKSCNIVKIQEKLHDKTSSDAEEKGNMLEKEKTQVITKPDSNFVKSHHIDNIHNKSKNEKMLFKKIYCESESYQANKFFSTDTKSTRNNLVPNECLSREYTSNNNTVYMKKSTQTTQEINCSNCEKLKNDQIRAKKKHDFLINIVDEPTGAQIKNEDYYNIKKELDHINEQNINLKVELSKKTAESEGLIDRIHSLELSLKTLKEAINVQDEQLNEYGSVVTSLKNSRSLAIEKMIQANERNTYNIMIIKNIEKEVENLRRQLDAYSELLINQNTELLDKASSTDHTAQEEQNCYAEKLKNKDNYIKLLQDRLCEAIVGLKNKDSEIKNHSCSIKVLINDYEREKKCLEERLKFASISTDRMELHIIKQQETMKQLMKLIEFLQEKLEKIDKK